MKTLATIVLCAALAAAVAVPAGALTLAPKPQEASPRGVGEVRLGRTIEALRGDGLIGGAQRGCELAQGERVAPLKGQLQGWAHFYPGRRLSSVAVTSGAATAAGVRIGTPVGEARKAYPAAPYDKPMTAAPFPVGFIWIGGDSNPKMTLVIDPDSLKVREIAVPAPSFCE